MFDKFTERARRVLGFATGEARKSGHTNLGTEHLLFGLAAETHGIAGQILNQAGLTTYFIRKQASKLVAAGSVTTGKSQIPFTPRARKVLDEADSIAKELGRSYVGTEHLLLGLLRDSESLAMQIILNGGQSSESLRTKVTEATLKQTAKAAPIPPRKSIDGYQLEIKEINDTNYTVTIKVEKTKSLGQTEVASKTITVRYAPYADVNKMLDDALLKAKTLAINAWKAEQRLPEHTA